MARSRSSLLLPVLLALSGCQERSERSPALKSLTPEPLPSVPARSVFDGGQEDTGSLHQVEPAPVWGEQAPSDAVTATLGGGGLRVGGQQVALEPKALAALGAKLKDASVLLQFDQDVYLAQAAPLLAVLDDAGAHLWFQFPGTTVALPVALRDEPAFQAWIDEPRPGKVRIIQRADGLELQTKMGKVSGGDPNGPSIPTRGGQLDIATLRRALARLERRFGNLGTVCVVPSFGTELVRIAQVLSGNYSAAGERIVDELCLVYPRPRPAP